MPVYGISVKEILKRTVIVEAENVEDAVRKAEEAVECEEVILDVDDFDDREIVPSEYWGGGGAGFLTEKMSAATGSWTVMMAVCSLKRRMKRQPGINGTGSPKGESIIWNDVIFPDGYAGETTCGRSWRSTEYRCFFRVEPI